MQAIDNTMKSLVAVAFPNRNTWQILMLSQCNMSKLIKKYGLLSRHPVRCSLYLVTEEILPDNMTFVTHTPEDAPFLK